MDFIAGIDGGGTKTNVLCQTLDGATLCQETFGAFNLNGIGEERFSALLRQLVDFLKAQGNCRALCIGAAGMSNPRLLELTEGAMTQGGIAHWRLVGDHEIALYGALEGHPGCLLIAGTGSICFGRNARGETARAGGWGHLIGDEGSGYALGRGALVAISREMDGLAGKTLLTQLVGDALGLKTRSDIIAYVYSGGKDRVAALSPLVDRAADLGDAAAGHILTHNAKQLAGLVSAVVRRLGLEEAETALFGGLLEHDTHLRRMLVEHLKEQLPQVTCVAARQSAVFGAGMMARELYQKSI